MKKMMSLFALTVLSTVKLGAETSQNFGVDMKATPADLGDSTAKVWCRGKWQESCPNISTDTVAGVRG